MTAPTRRFETTPEHRTGVSAIRPLGREGADAMVGRRLGGKLLVGEQLGAGALGVVYRATHVALGRTVAVKVLHERLASQPALRAQLQHEARAASLLDHPNLVGVIDFSEEPDGTLWLAMELLDGVELRTLLRREGKLPAARAAELMLQVCAALAHAHARGVVHGDVKPSNIMVATHVDDDGAASERAKLCDFGVARAPIQDAPVASAGTPAYMSPEQCLGEPLDARSDVYACGVVLYELVTGVLPFDDDDPEAVLRQHLLVQPDPPSLRVKDLAPAVDAVILKALAKDPESRHATMRELRAELKQLVADRGHEARGGIGPPDESGKFPRLLGGHRERQALAELLAEGVVEDVAACVWRLSSMRTPASAHALELLDDPGALAPIAERLLDDDVPASPYVEAMLERAGAAGARALWNARVGSPPTVARRRRFAFWLAQLGPKASWILLAALKRLEPTTHEYPDLVEDVLLAVPRSPNPALAAAATPFTSARWRPVQELARAAVARASR